MQILCSGMVRPMSPFGNLLAGFRAKRWGSRHGRRGIAPQASSTPSVCSSPRQVEAEASRDRYAPALTEGRLGIVVSVAGGPHRDVSLGPVVGPDA